MKHRIPFVALVVLLCLAAENGVAARCVQHRWYSCDGWRQPLSRKTDCPTANRAFPAARSVSPALQEVQIEWGMKADEYESRKRYGWDKMPPLPDLQEVQRLLLETPRGDVVIPETVPSE